MNPVESIIANTVQSPPTETPEDQDDDDVITGPLATSQQVLKCQFSSWYPTFSNIEGRKRANVTIKSVIIRELPEDLEDYLLSDGVQLPADAGKFSACAHGNAEWSSDEEYENAGDEENEEASFSQEYKFPKLNQDLVNAIESLNGSVLPKMNWSAPKDATWVNGGSLKCETPGDVYVLIKSSDFCLHDVLRKAWKNCEDYDPSKTPPRLELVLRKWCSLHPSMEFRCFVRQHELIAISQRNHTQHYAHLAHDQPQILETLMMFFEATVINRFAEGEIPNYVFDVYLDQKNRVWVLDFNVWASSTDSLLFEWSELLTMDMEDDPQFRLVETANQVRQDPLASYRAPVDTLDLASLTGGVSKNFEDFMKQCQSPSQLDDAEEKGETKKLEDVD
jgi:hypothetical protein